MSNGQSSPNWAFGYIPSPTEWNTAFATKQDANVPQLISGNVTLTASGDYGYTGGSTADWTLPALASQISPYNIKNMGGGNLTIHGHVSEDIYDTVAANTLVLAPGASAYLANYGTVWGASVGT